MPQTNKQNEQVKKVDQESSLINFEWRAPEFEKYEKSAGWFIAVGLIGLIVFTIALFMENFIFAFIVVLAIFIVFVYALKEPRIIQFEINDEGITIDGRLHPYEDFKSFWIFSSPSIALSVKSKRLFTPLIKIPLADQAPVKVRQELTRFVPEEKQEESLIDTLSRYLKF